MVHIWTLNYDLVRFVQKLLDIRIQLIIIVAEHTCLFDQSAARAHDLKASIMAECQKLNSTVTLVQAYRFTEQLLQESPPAVVEAMRTPHEMRSKLSKRRRKQLPGMQSFLQNSLNWNILNDVPGGPPIRKRFFSGKNCYSWRKR